MKFDSNGGYDTPVTQTVRGGNQVVEPKDPKRDGYEFMAGIIPMRTERSQMGFSDPVHKNMTLKANGKSLRLRKQITELLEKVSKKKDGPGKK